MSRHPNTYRVSLAHGAPVIPYVDIRRPGLGTADEFPEASLRDDLNRILAGEGFDFDRDVRAVYLYRWGYGPVGAPPKKCWRCFEILLDRLSRPLPWHTYLGGQTGHRGVIMYTQERRAGTVTGDGAAD